MEQQIKADPGVQSAAQEELDAICRGAVFSKAPALGRLLTFLVERELAGQGDLLRETFIGVEFFGRSPAYDPKIDSVVRVSATRLRARLEEHYAEDRPRGCRIVLRKGSYVPMYESLEQDAPESADPEPDLTSGESTVPAAPAGRMRLMIAALAICFLLLAGGLMRWRGRVRPVQQTWTVRPFARFGGSQQFADFSPDGRSVVFVSSDLQSTRRNVYVQDLAGEGPRRLTNDATEESRPAWSPDGRRVAFLRLDGKAHREVVTLDVATGEQARVASLTGDTPWLCGIARLSWTRDGSELISSAAQNESTACGLVAIDVKRGTIREIGKPLQGTLGDLEAAVSPDGKSIAFLRTTSFAVSDLYVVGLDGTGVRQVTHDQRDILGFCWSEDGASLVVSSNRVDGQLRLWHVPLDGGEAQALTDGASSPAFPALSRNGEQIVFTQYQPVSDLWKKTAEATTQLTQNEGVNSSPAVSPDGRHLVYSSTRTGAPVLWISDTDGRNARQLIKDGQSVAVSGAAWSPDGKRLVLECRYAGVRNLCLLDGDGSNLTRMTHSASDQILPSWSRDGQHIYFGSNSTGRYQIYRQDISGGSPLQLTRRGGKRAIESEGGSLLVHRGPAGGLVALPIQAVDAGASGLAELAAAEDKVLLEKELTSDKIGDWEPVGSEVVFFGQKEDDRVNPIFHYRFADGLLNKVGHVDALSYEDVQNIAVAPDLSAIYYRKQTSSTELSLLRKESR